MSAPRLVASLLASACALALLLPASAPAAQDLFLTLDGIPGESRDDGHRGAIDVLSFGWGVSTPAAAGGRASFQEFTATKGVDRASPPLLLHAAAGRVIRTAVLSVRRAGEGRGDHLRYCMTDVRITELTTAGSASEDRPTERVSLVYGTLSTSYRAQNPDGSLSTPFTGGWDLARNTLLGTSSC